MTTPSTPNSKTDDVQSLCIKSAFEPRVCMPTTNEGNCLNKNGPVSSSCCFFMESVRLSMDFDSSMDLIPKDSTKQSAYATTRKCKERCTSVIRHLEAMSPKSLRVSPVIGRFVPHSVRFDCIGDRSAVKC